MAATMNSSIWPVVVEEWTEKVYRMAIADSSDKDFLSWRYCGHGVAEIVDLQVGSERGVGKGRSMMEGLFSLIRQAQAGGEPHKNIRKVFAMTRATNRIAQEFYVKVGFRRIGILHGFYPDPGDDSHAVVFGRDV